MSMFIFAFVLGCVGLKDPGGSDVEPEQAPYICTEDVGTCPTKCWSIYEGGYFEYARECVTTDGVVTCEDAIQSYFGEDGDDTLCATCTAEGEATSIMASVCGLVAS